MRFKKWTSSKSWYYLAYCMAAVCFVYTWNYVGIQAAETAMYKTFL